MIIKLLLIKNHIEIIKLFLIKIMVNNYNIQNFKILYEISSLENKMII